MEESAAIVLQVHSAPGKNGSKCLKRGYCLITPAYAGQKEGFSIGLGNDSD